jgi:hypothetical protein
MVECSNFGGMNVVFHTCKPNIYNLLVLNPVKISRLNKLETYPFR